MGSTNALVEQKSQTKLYSFRLSCNIVSLTAAKTNRMFSVSEKIIKSFTMNCKKKNLKNCKYLPVAHVKCE
jgi:hypothetical protein